MGTRDLHFFRRFDTEEVERAHQLEFLQVARLK
jgi:hypothetical protein